MKIVVDIVEDPGPSADYACYCGKTILDAPTLYPRALVAGGCERRYVVTDDGRRRFRRPFYTLEGAQHALAKLATNDPEASSSGWEDA